MNQAVQKEEKELLPEDVISIRMMRVQRSHDWKNLILCLVITGIVIYLLVGVIFGVAVISGDSMYPTYQDGDVVLFYRLAKNYQTSDIVLVQEEGATTYIKRIIGMPGEEVDIEEGAGTVLINALQIEESYAVGRTLKKPGIKYPVDLKDDEYFILGDNREDSMDSRNFGAITKKQIKGKELAVLRMS